MNTGFLRAPYATVTLGLAILLAGCGTDPTESSGPVKRIEALPRALTAAEEQVVQASNRFAFDLLREVRNDNAGSNVFISPLSASMALGMTMNGAEGGTFDAMRDALRFGELSREEINQSYAGLIALLRGLDPSVVFGIGNSIWYRQGFPVRPEFTADAETYFDATVRALDFSDPGSADVIDAWVDAETNGKIKNIITRPITPDIVMFLINAIYFKGTWTYEFDRGATEQAPFYRSDGSTVPVMLMSQETDLRYGWGPGYQVIDLPYGGDAFSLTVLLPAQGVPLDSLVESLDANAWEELLAGLEVAGLHLYLPRFKLEYEKRLNDALGALGMGVAFTDDADFSRIAEGSRLQISEVKQKTFVEVDERGTEAAAVTVVAVRETSVGGGPPVVRVDRPFLFAIRERLSGTILFVGTLLDPSAG